jgi:hypothetical protein
LPGREAEQERRRGDQDDRHPVPRDGGEGVELDECADHDPDDDVRAGQRRPGDDDPARQRQRPDEPHGKSGEERRRGDGQGLETGRGHEGENRDDEEVERAGPPP